MLKKIFCIILVISSVFSIFSCTQEPKELTEAERIEQMISDIGAITKYDEATKAKVEEAVNAYNNYINSLELPALSEIDSEKVDELKELMLTQALYNYAKSLIDVVIFDIKAKLYRPSSFELNLLTLEVYKEKKGQYSVPQYFFQIYVDYSAQTMAGGYNRSTESLWDAEFVSDSSNSTEINFVDIYNKTASPSRAPSNSLEEYFKKNNIEGHFIFSMAKSDITWTLE